MNEEYMKWICMMQEYEEKEYKREKLKELEDKDIVGQSEVNGMMIFYSYNSEGVDDIGWGCAWRCI